MPSGFTERIAFVVRSTVAIALCSWIDTYAVIESAETATYSGSRSCPIVGLPGPNGTIDGSITPAARPLNPSVVTLACVIALPVTSMMLIEPSGSTA